MAFDEFHFHRKRGLSRWERLGHPIDTASLLACYTVTLTQAPDARGLVIYAALGAFSCLLVTKDEFVHARECRPSEHWLHALLFVLHPLVLGAIAVLWIRGERTLLLLQTALTSMFGLYQLLYWNLPWQRRSRAL
jgi:hypothetical protein